VQIGNEGTSVETIIDDLGFESSLKNMADAIVAFVVTNGERGEEPGHGLAEIALGGGEEQVIVVWHEHVGAEVKGIGMASLAESLKKLGVFVVGGENDPTFV